jgi:hypothetical protein
MNDEQKEIIEMMIQDFERNLDCPYGVTKYDFLRLLYLIKSILSSFPGKTETNEKDSL